MSTVGRSSEVASRQGVITLLVNTALMNAGFTMLIPLISVHFTTDYGMSGAAIGAILGVRQFTQQGLMMVGGALGDRWGHKPVICAGYLVRAIGFLGFAVANTVPGLVISAVVAALGGAFFEATSKAALAALTPPERRSNVFSMASLFGGVGLAVGPLLGVALLQVSFFWVGIAAAACFFAASATSLVLLPSIVPTEAGGGPTPLGLGATLRLVCRDGQFVRFTVLLTGYWFLSNQIYISVPLLALRLTGDAGVVGVIFTMQALAAIILQVPLTRLASRYLRPLVAIALGILLMAGGLGAMALAATGPALVACALAFAIGRVTIEPIKDTLTAELAAPGAVAAYFGFGFLALAFGGTAGNYVGGWLMDLAAAPELRLLPWAIFAAIGVASAIGLALFRVGPRPAASHRPSLGANG